MKKLHWSKEHAGEIDYNALEENLWDEAYNYLVAKAWEEEADRLKTRIEKILKPKNSSDEKK